MVKAIVAVDKEWGIGYQNKLLIRIPNDMKRFKEITTGNVVIMGKNTFVSIGSKPLSNRINIIITHEYTSPVRDNNGVIYMDIKNAIDYILNVKSVSNFLHQDVYIIGGASIYEQLLPYCDEVLTTQIEKTFDADVYFPNLNNNPSWEFKDDTIRFEEYDGVQYSFVDYKRINHNG